MLLQTLPFEACSADSYRRGRVPTLLSNHSGLHLSHNLLCPLVGWDSVWGGYLGCPLAHLSTSVLMCLWQVWTESL